MKTITIEFVDGKKDIKIQAKDLKSAIEMLVKQRTDLYRAILSGANLEGADLEDVDLAGAYLYGADLKGINLAGANLSNANLSKANLRDADLSRANLSGANLSGADLAGTNLSEAGLKYANLSEANLSGADLSKADLYETDLSGADLSGANLSDAILYRADLTDVKGLDYQICPEKGSFIAYKATTTGVIKIEIPEDAKRTSCIRSRKCRASKIKVLDGDGCGGFSPTHTKKSLIYNQGDVIESDSFDSDPREECTNGIHFFMSKQEALDWFNHI